MDEVKNLKNALEQKQSVLVYACYSIAYIIRKVDEKFKQIYCSDNEYWRGKSAIQQLSKASGSMKEETKNG